MRMCLPSTGPKQCWKFHLSSKPFEILSHSLWQFGVFKNWSFTVWNIASDVSARILLIVAFLIAYSDSITKAMWLLYFTSGQISQCNSQPLFCRYWLLKRVVCWKINVATSENKHTNLSGDIRRYWKKRK